MDKMEKKRLVNEVPHCPEYRTGYMFFIDTLCARYNKSVRKYQRQNRGWIAYDWSCYQ